MTPTNRQYLIYMRFAFHLLIGSVVGLASCREERTQAPPFTFDTESDEALVDFIPPLESISSVTVTNLLQSKQTPRQLTVDEWQTLLALLADTKPVRLHHDLTVMGEINIRDKDGKMFRIWIYRSTLGPVCQLSSSGPFATIKNKAAIEEFILNDGKSEN